MTRLERLNSRERAMLAAVLLLIVAWMITRYAVAPAYRQWRDVGVLLQARTSEFARLQQNLQVKDQVNQQFSALPAGVEQTQSDADVFATFLRDLEAMARLPSMTVTNMRPMGVTQERSTRVFRVRLSVVATPADVSQFVATATGADAVVAVDNFSVHGTQGGQTIECQLGLRLIRLAAGLPITSAKPRSAPRVTRNPDE